MKKLLQYSLLVTIPTWICLELLGLISARLVPRLYGSRTIVASIEAIDATRLVGFMATIGSTTLGWDVRPGSTVSNNDCTGARHFATYDQARARVFDGYDAAAVTSILVGDSYTHGDEVGDGDTIAAHLWRQDGIMTANLGVPGYSPLQAVIKAKERHQDYPSAKLIVLGIMYENIRRNVNSYLPIWLFPDSENTQFIFALRPYMAGAVTNHLPPETFAELSVFKARAKASLEADFWARPMQEFPYAASLIRALTSNSSISRLKAGLYTMRGAYYEGEYRNEQLTVPLFAVIEEFFLWSRDQGIKPIVVFLPRNRLDRTSAALWIRDFAPRLPANGVVVDARMDDADWTRFNVRGDVACHPSSYGYGRIAAAYAAALAPLPRDAAPQRQR